LAKGGHPPLVVWGGDGQRSDALISQLATSMISSPKYSIRPAVTPVAKINFRTEARIVS
jgi:hypothetical protein